MKEKILVAEISDVDNLQQGQLDLIDKNASGSGYGSEESPLYIKKGSGIYTIEGAPYSIIISWSAGPVTRLYRTSITYTVDFPSKIEMISDSLNFTWGAGYTIHFTGSLQFKYWTSPTEFQIAYHTFIDATYQVPEQYWG